MARLRGPNGCPWDREQDHTSLRDCLLEETYETLEAIDKADPEALCQELGDLLLQIVFHAQLASEQGQFDIGDIIQSLHDKLIARHPHVFADKHIETAEGVVREWESLKRHERKQRYTEQMAEVPKELPALARAQRALQRAILAGHESSAEKAREAIVTALERLKLEKSEGFGSRTTRPGGQAEATQEIVGELLLAIVELARTSGVDAEQALRVEVERLIGKVRKSEL